MVTEVLLDQIHGHEWSQGLPLMIVTRLTQTLHPSSRTSQPSQPALSLSLQFKTILKNQAFTLPIKVPNPVFKQQTLYYSCAPNLAKMGNLQVLLSQKDQAELVSGSMMTSFLLSTPPHSALPTVKVSVVNNFPNLLLIYNPTYKYVKAEINAVMECGAHRKNSSSSFVRYAQLQSLSPYLPAVTAASIFCILDITVHLLYEN